MEDIVGVSTAKVADVVRQTKEAQAADIVKHIFNEMQLHIKYCEGWGISTEEITKTSEHQGALKYFRFSSADLILGSMYGVHPICLGHRDVTGLDRATGCPTAVSPGIWRAR